jgi:hypothetical protein
MKTKGVDSNLSLLRLLTYNSEVLHKKAGRELRKHTRADIVQKQKESRPTSLRWRYFDINRASRNSRQGAGQN